MSGFLTLKKELLDSVKARKLAYYGHTMRKQGSCLEKEIMQGTMPGARRRGRPRTAWMDNIKTWTGLSVEESIRMTEDRDKWRKYVRGVANPRIEEASGAATGEGGKLPPLWVDVQKLCNMCVLSLSWNFFVSHDKYTARPSSKEPR